MKAKILKKTKDVLLIQWEKNGVGFGQLTMKWNPKGQEFYLDTECMGVDHVIEVFKALEDE